MSVITDYNNSYYSNCLGANYHDRDFWLKIFRHNANNIVETLNPRSVLDVGCAFGYLVEALRERGVEAWGLDFSEYAISQADPSIQEYLCVQSATDPLPEHFPERFDLVTTIEMLEHMNEADGILALDNLVEYSDTLLISAAYICDENPTHINVQAPEYWIEKLAERGFYEIPSYDAGFVTPQAFLVQKKANYSLPQMAFDYKHALWLESCKNKHTIQQLSQEKINLEARLQESEHQYELISNATFWKMSKPFRTIMDFFRGNR